MLCLSLLIPFLWPHMVGGENLSTCSNLKTRKSLFSEVGAGQNVRVVGLILQIYHVQVCVGVKRSLVMSKWLQSVVIIF